MDAGLFNMLHDAADGHPLAITQRIDIDLIGIIQKLIDQHRPTIPFNMLIKPVKQLLLVEYDGHAAPAQHIAWPNQDGIADFLRGGGLAASQNSGAGRLGNAKSLHQIVKTFAVFRQINGIHRRPPYSGAHLLQIAGDVQRRLPAKLH